MTHPVSSSTGDTLSPSELATFANRVWDEEIVPALVDYIAVPAKSPAFDAQWEVNGFLDKVVRDAAEWINSKKIDGLKLEVLRLPNRSPVIFFEVPATKPGCDDTILMYGHLDKQPEFDGWRRDLGPWTPKYEDGKLYGRGGADDGYAVYASLTALMALDRQNIPRPRCVGVIETCEESGSFDLPPYLDILNERLGNVSLVVCLDSGAGNYDQLWLTTSLRGMVSGTLKVEVLTEGIHSGAHSGVVPSSFRILRHVLDRLEDAKTGRLLPASFHCEIPQVRLEEAKATAAILKEEVYKRLPWACGADGAPVLPVTTDPVEAILNRTWRPTLSVVGAEGFPDFANAGNVLRPYTAFKLSLRLPPLLDGNAAALQLKTLLEDNAPYNARVSFVPDGTPGSYGASGWNTPELSPWLATAVNAASESHFGTPVGYLGEGGTIPLMGLLQKSFPRAQMMVCGVLGPKSNAHGPNEFLHVPYGKRLTAAVAQVIAAHP
jgi:acetylornithine deacetylase/succinyl-diaminopimelate desuccinylase-like protein